MAYEAEGKVRTVTEPLIGASENDSAKAHLLDDEDIEEMKKSYEASDADDEEVAS